MTNLPHNASQLRVADLSARRDNRFDLVMTDEDLANLAKTLGIIAVKKLSFEGTIKSEGKRDWRLQADLGATVVQACVVTLAPVTTRIDTPVLRRFVADYTPADQDEDVEMSEDDTIEAIPELIDLLLVATESLALALPDYPRARGVEHSESVFSAPGIEPLRDGDLNPFASLAGLKEKLENGDGEM